jgi:hypothetical protein
MDKANALTDAIGLVIAVSFALQTAVGPGLNGLVELLASRVSNLVARLVAIGCGGLIGGLLGVVAWQSDGNRGWIAIGVLAGLLVGTGQRLRSGSTRAGSVSNEEAAQCDRDPHCTRDFAD